LNFTQYDLGYRHRGEILEVSLRGTEANVELLDSSNLSAFKRGRRHRYYGGHYKRSPALIPIPRAGHWYAVVHLGGFGGSVRSGVRVLPGVLPPGHSVSRSPLGAIMDAADEYSVAMNVEPEAKEFDVFVCHASEDKDSVVRPLAVALRELGLDTWYDEFELKIGDSLRRKIDKGIVSSRFGVVVLSKAFFDKGWPNYELDGLVTREVAGGQPLILPVWHGVTRDDVMSYSPSLADKLARNTADVSINAIAAEIVAVIQPSVDDDEDEDEHDS
jgi:hypothetical protein